MRTGVSSSIVDRSRLTGIVAGDPRRFPDEESIDVPRYLSALRRGAWLVALIVIPLTASVLVLSLVLPKTYSAVSSLVLEDPSGSMGSDAETSTQRLATIQRLLTSREVLEAAADKLPRRDGGHAGGQGDGVRRRCRQHRRGEGDGR